MGLVADCTDIAKAYPGLKKLRIKTDKIYMEKPYLELLVKFAISAFLKSLVHLGVYFVCRIMSKIVEVVPVHPHNTTHGNTCLGPTAAQVGYVKS